jgi:hypothetical protein
LNNAYHCPSEVQVKSVCSSTPGYTATQPCQRAARCGDRALPIPSFVPLRLGLRCSKDAAPERSFELFDLAFYKDFTKISALTGFPNRIRTHS